MTFKKKFVSVYLSSSTLQVVQLSADRKKVLKFLSVNLPPGLIKNFRVTDTKVLSEALNAIWKKMHLKEKSVAIIIPEFSSLIKTFDLPSLSDEELDEAVRWHASDFLPDDSTRFYLDWKVVSENDDKTQILAASVEKEILKGYIESFEAAGLLPLMVETPSLALTNLLPSEPVGRLIIYLGSGETLLVMSLGKKIVGSSVIGGSSVDQLGPTAKRMIKYYSNIKVEQVFVGGNPASKALFDQIKQILDIPAVNVTMAIHGLSGDQINEYLIPLSSQLKDIYEPTDRNTVNLLPPELIDKYYREKLKLNVWTLSLFVTLVVWFSFISTIVVYFYLGSRAVVTPTEQSQSQNSQEQSKLLAEVKATNALSQKVVNIVASSYSPEMLLNSIYSAKPEGINITEYFINFENGEIRIKGISTTRVQLIDFKYKLEENKDFSLVSVPISSFEKERDFDFEMNFSYLPIKSAKVTPKPQVKK